MISYSRHASLGAALIVLTLSALIAGTATAGEIEKLTGPYFGQKPPGPEAEVFAPGLVSVEGRYEFAISFAPDHMPRSLLRLLSSARLDSAIGLSESSRSSQSGRSTRTR